MASSPAHYKSSGRGGSLVGASWAFAFLVWPVGLILSLVSRSRGNRYVGPLVCSLIVGVLSIGFAVASSHTTSTSRTPAANSYLSAWNTLIASEKAASNEWNGGADAASATAGINADIAADQAFATAVGQITFPSNDQSDATKVLSANTALETTLSALASVTGNPAVFNQEYPQYTAAFTALSAANATLSSDLGLVVK